METRPPPTNPISIIAHVDDSGTAAMEETSKLKHVCPDLNPDIMPGSRDSFRQGWCKGNADV